MARGGQAYDRKLAGPSMALWPADSGSQLLFSLGVTLSSEHFADFARQVVRREGLLQEVPVRVQQAVMQEGAIGVSGKKQDPQIRPQGAHVLGQLRTAELRHDHVGYHEVHG